MNLVRLRSVPLNLLGDHFYLAHRLRYIAPHLGELEFDLVGFILEFERQRSFELFYLLEAGL